MSEVSDVYNLEQELKGKKELAARRQMALRLYDNRDFQALILEGFMLHEAARYVQVSGDPDLSLEQRADALNLAQASGHLKRYLSAVVQTGSYAERTLFDTEQALEEARAEEGAV